MNAVVLPDSALTSIFSVTSWTSSATWFAPMLNWTSICGGSGD